MLRTPKLSEVNKTMLNRIWEHREPVTLNEILRWKGLSTRTQARYLKREGFITISNGGLILTEKGRKALGFPSVDEEKARKILGTTSLENPFHFYAEIDQPLGISADGLMDFCEKIGSVNVRSIEFHMTRGDFESWIRFLKDTELAKRLELIRINALSGETLREILSKALNSRCDELRGKIA